MTCDAETTELNEMRAKLKLTIFDNVHLSLVPLRCRRELNTHFQKAN